MIHQPAPSRTTALIALLALASAAQAQTAPDAGALLRQAEQRKPPTSEPPSKPLLEAARAAEQAASGGARVQLRRFTLEGHTLLGEAQLQEKLKPWLGRTVDLAGLREAAAAVCAAYAEAGWLAHCDLPPQDITEGLVRIRVLEARFAGLQIEGAPQRFRAERARAMLEQALTPGRPLAMAPLERALLLLDDLPGLSAGAALGPGAQAGDTTVHLKLADTSLWSADLGLDNGGQRSTGIARSNALLRLDSALGLGESFNALLLHSSGNNYLRLSASLPLGLDGWRIGANTSSLRYELQGTELQALAGRGSARGLGLEASYPLIRSRSHNLALQLTAERKRFDNEAGGVSSSRYSASSAAIGLSGNFGDSFKGANAAGLILSAGRLNLAGSANELADAQGPATQGRYAKLQYSYSRQQGLSSWLSASLNFAGQAASKNLDTAERFYLGGPGGVRAYPSSEGGGSEGQLLSLELRALLPAQLNLAGFYDWGRVTVLKDAAAAAGSGPNSFSLKGLGATLGWNGPRGLNLRATVARRIGANPNPSPTGSDQDGTLKRHRLWLQASLPL